ncbi:MAG: hypothetical protein LUE89_08850 [Clostridiales bacterium]|nr:hypothetical protein [Clostridiales bacterium]
MDAKKRNTILCCLLMLVAVFLLLSIIMDIAALRETMRGFNTLVVKMEEMQTYVEENLLILPTN